MKTKFKKGDIVTYYGHFAKYIFKEYVSEISDKAMVEDKFGTLHKFHIYYLEKVK